MTVTLRTTLGALRGARALASWDDVKQAIA